MVGAELPTFHFSGRTYPKLQQIAQALCAVAVRYGLPLVTLLLSPLLSTRRRPTSVLPHLLDTILAIHAMVESSISKSLVKLPGHGLGSGGLRRGFTMAEHIFEAVSLGPPADGWLAIFSGSSGPQTTTPLVCWGTFRKKTPGHPDETLISGVIADNSPGGPVRSLTPAAAAANFEGYLAPGQSGPASA